jgi:hypothetical protein
MMDGATGLSDRPLFHPGSDAYWLVDRYHDYFTKNDLSGRTLTDYVKDAIVSVGLSTHDLTILDGVPAHCLPSAGLFLGVAEHDRLRYLQLGDCKCLVHASEQIQLLGHSSLELLDEAVILEINRLQAAGLYKFVDVWHELLPLLQKNRSMANREGGYWILGFDIRAAENALQGEIELSTGDSLLAMSDGFTRLFDKFNLIRLESLMPTLRDLTLTHLIEKLRESEINDPECLNFPRIKCHDDSSALLLQIDTI